MQATTLGLAAKTYLRGKGRSAVSREVVCNSIQILDICACLAGGIIATSLHYSFANDSNAFQSFIYPVTIGTITLSFALYKSGAYEFRNLLDLTLQIRRAAICYTTSVALLAMIAYMSKEAELYSRSWAIMWFSLTFAQLLLSRLVLCRVLDYWSKRGLIARVIAIVGSDEPGERLVAKLREAQESELVIAGIYDDRKNRCPDSVGGHAVLGTTDDLLSLARNVLIDEIIIALPLHAERRIGALVEKLRAVPVDLRLSIETINSFPIRGLTKVATAKTIEIVDRPLKNWSRVAKWLEDKIISACLLILCAPLMGLIALAIRLETRGPIFFVQNRFGFNNELIPVFKFRTMHASLCDQSGATRTVQNDVRVTRVGRVLRALSLDELPQLVNVLRGNMSLVGPRPHVPQMKAGEQLYHEAVASYFIRHHVRPGLTGWAQVHNCRGEINSLEKARERVEYDIFYIDHWSLWLDFKILLKTIAVVLQGQNAY